MYCKHCGTKVLDDALFCPSCGKVLQETVSKEQNVVYYEDKKVPKVWEVFSNIGYNFGKWTLIFCWVPILNISLFLCIAIYGLVFSILGTTKAKVNRQKAKSGIIFSSIAMVAILFLYFLYLLCFGSLLNIRFR
ncbi:MAG: zinc ribbon domain-containing protein [Acholeplasmatales bacterium]|jgi:VIT1/CCC1 family predicted Fe2+/Mn2+ transporter|nr:zinc ribbon domain-containing protein [Acholeplasmatales bacterium]